MEPTDGEEQPRTNGDISQQPEPSNFRTELVLFRDALTQRAQPLLDARREALERTSERPFWEQVLIETAETDIVECIREAIGLLGANLDDFGARVPPPDALATWLLDGGRRCLLSLMEANRLEGPPSSVALMLAVQTVLRQFAQECAQQRSFWPQNNRLVDLQTALWGADLVATGFLHGVFAGTNATVALSEGLRLSDRYKSEHASENAHKKHDKHDRAKRDIFKAYLRENGSSILNPELTRATILRAIQDAADGMKSWLPPIDWGANKPLSEPTQHKVLAEFDREQGTRRPVGRPTKRSHNVG